VSRGIDIIIVHDGPERGAHVQHSQYELLKGIMPYTTSIPPGTAFGSPMLMGHTFRGFVTPERWAQLLALVLAGHAERMVL
jgi:hypothetical protein